MEGDDILERLHDGVPFGPRMFEDMTELRLAAIAEVQRLRTRIAEIDRSTAALGYLARNVVEPLNPGTAPAPDLMGVCVQVGEIVTALQARLEAGVRAEEALLSALGRIAQDPTADPDDLREIARTAMAARGVDVPA